MHPVEVWWMIEAKMPQKIYAGGMTEYEADECYDRLQEMRKNG